MIKLIMNIAAEWRGKNNGDASGGTALSVNLNGRKAPPAFRGDQRVAAIMTPRPVASRRPSDPPSSSGLPVTTAVQVWPTCML